MIDTVVPCASIMTSTRASSVPDAGPAVAVNLSDEQIEYQVRDRLSFTRFLGRGVEDGIPDGTTLWLFREKLARAGLIEKLFDRFDQHLNAKGYIARGGQMVDASIVPVPKQRNAREENEAVGRGQSTRENCSDTRDQISSKPSSGASTHPIQSADFSM